MIVTKIDAFIPAASVGGCMPYIRRTVCLANCRPMTGRCVADLKVVGSNLRRWIRPVSAGPTEDGRGLA